MTHVSHFLKPTSIFVPIGEESIYPTNPNNYLFTKHSKEIIKYCWDNKCIEFIDATNTKTCAAIKENLSETRKKIVKIKNNILFAILII